MKPFETEDGHKFTNAVAWRGHKASLAARKPGSMPQADGDGTGEESSEAQPEAHHEEIHQGLQNLQMQTGNRHTHVEHHADGGHTSHHIDHSGQIHSHDHANTEALKAHLDGITGEGEEGAGDEHDGGREEATA